MTDRNQDHQHQHQQEPAQASRKAGVEGTNGEAVQMVESTAEGLFWRVQVARNSAGQLRVTAVEGELREFPAVFVSTYKGGERRHTDCASSADPHAVASAMVAFLRVHNLAK